MKKVLSLVLVLTVFAAMALGSGSSKSKSTVGTASATAAQDSKAAENADAESTTEATTTEAEIKYEVTDTQFNYYKNSIDKLEYYGIVEIENTGTSYLYLADCTFDLEDDNGHLLQSDDFVYNCPDVIAPGEKGYFFNGLGSNYIDDGVSLDNGVKLVPQFKLEICNKGAAAIVDFEVSDTEMKDGKYGPKVTGRITNSTDKDCGYLSIFILYFDSEGKVVTIDIGSVDGLDAGLTKSFDCDLMEFNEEITGRITDFKVIARDDYMQF